MVPKPKQCPFGRPTIWYLVYCATCLGSRDNSKYHTYPPTHIHDPSRISIDCLTPASRLRRSDSVWTTSRAVSTIPWPFLPRLDVWSPPPSPPLLGRRAAGNARLRSAGSLCSAAPAVQLYWLWRSASPAMQTNTRRISRQSQLAEPGQCHESRRSPSRARTGVEVCIVEAERRSGRGSLRVFALRWSKITGESRGHLGPPQRPKVEDQRPKDPKVVIFCNFGWFFTNRYLWVLTQVTGVVR